VMNILYLVCESVRRMFFVLCALIYSLVSTAPTDEAFESLSPQEMEYIQANLYMVIQLHVIKKKTLTASLLVNGDRHMTLSRGIVNVAVSSDIMINDARIVTPDIMAKNGVIHVIDKVLIANPGDDKSLQETCYCPAGIITLSIFVSCVDELANSLDLSQEDKQQFIKDAEQSACGTSNSYDNNIDVEETDEYDDESYVYENENSLDDYVESPYLSDEDLEEKKDCMALLLNCAPKVLRRFEKPVFSDINTDISKLSTDYEVKIMGASQY